MDERVGAVLAIIILAICSVPLFSQPSDAISHCGNTIALAQAKQTAYVAPGQDGVVTFTGTVFISIPWTQTTEWVEVQLFTNVGDWVATTPDILTFTRAEKQKNFAVTVYVPIGSSQSKQGQLEVWGKWKCLNSTGAGTIPPATAIIFVKQFYEIEIDAPEGFIRINQGDGVNTQIQLKNRGNSKEHIRSEISNRKELEDSGWEIEFGPDKIEIAEGCTSRINLTMNSTERVEVGIYNVNISVVGPQSLCLDQDPPFTYALFIEVEERELLGIKFKIWVALEWSLIALLGMVTAFLVMTKKKLTKIAYSKLSRTNE